MDLKEYRKVKEKFLKDAQKVLAKEFKAFFAKYPSIDALRWEQYTPSFNDGDVCEFSRHEFSARVLQKNKKGEGEIGTAELISATEADEDGFYEGYDIDGDTPLGKAISELENEFGSVDDGFKEAFGDGVKVIATRKGFEVEECYHD